VSVARVTVLAATAALLAAGCGGDDEPADRPPAPIPDAFTEQVGTICDDVAEQITELGTRPSRTKDQSGFLQHTNFVSASLFDGLRQLRALRLPPGEAGHRAKRAIDEHERRLERFDVASEALLTAVVEGRDERAALERYRDALNPAIHAPLREVLGAEPCSFDASDAAG
jgi:hypothetical protein